MSERGVSVPAFRRLLGECGADLHGVELVCTTDEFGTANIHVKCVNNVAAGTCVFSLPRSLAITPESLKETDEWRDVCACGDGQRGAAIVVAWLMRQRFFPEAGQESTEVDSQNRPIEAVTTTESETTSGTETEAETAAEAETERELASEKVGVTVSKRHDLWQAYVQQLPDKFDDAFHWSDSERELLAGTNLAASLPEAERILRDVFESLLVRGTSVRFPARWPVGEVTWERWLWAHSAYISRSFPRALLRHAGAASHVHDGSAHAGIFLQPSASCPCLLPLIDSCDHDSQVRVTWQLGGDDRVSLIFEEPLSVGDVVKNNYGAKFDEDLLFCYGFVEGRACYPVRLTNGKRYILTLADPIPAELVTDLAAMLGAEPEDLGDPDLELAVCDVIMQLLPPRYAVLADSVELTGDEAKERVMMAETYRNGQRDVVAAALSHVRKRQCDLA